MTGNLAYLRRRIRTVRNTQKLTKAMKTVSAAKLRRATSELRRNQPYAHKLMSLLLEVRRRLKIADHPLLKERGQGEVVLVVVTADKGLCGSFNSHVLKKAEEHYRQLAGKEDAAVSLVTVGNKGFRYFSKHQFPIKRNFPSLISRLTPEGSRQLADYLQETYLQQEVRRIEAVATQFHSASRQHIEVVPLFPLPLPPPAAEEEEEDRTIIEPDAMSLFQLLLPRLLYSRIQRLLLGSVASEDASRMIAMDLATRNASDMIRSLQMELNKLRQASITKELLEIMTATEALKK